MVYYFNYDTEEVNALVQSLGFTKLTIQEDFRYSWGSFLQHDLIDQLGGGEPYGIFVRTGDDGEYVYDDQLLVKWGEHYIDVVGIYTEFELLRRCREESTQRGNGDNVQFKFDSVVPFTGYDDGYTKYSEKVRECSRKAADIIATQVRLQIIAPPPIEPIMCSDCKKRPGYAAQYKMKPGTCDDEDWFDPKATYYTPAPDSDAEDEPVYLCCQCDPCGYP